MVETNTSGKTLFAVRQAYILFYVIFVVLNKFIPFSMAVDGKIATVVYGALAVFGALLLVWDLFTRRSLFRIKYGVLLVGFFIAMALSIVYNIKYGWADNAKTFVWMAIQVFLVAAPDVEQPLQKHKKLLSLVSKMFIVIWFVGVCWSFGQYMVQYSAEHIFSTGEVVPEGFIFGRLFGIFTDPNVASVCSLISITLCLYLMKEELHSKFNRIFYIVSISFNIIYIVLSGSRTGEIILIGLSLVGAVLGCITKYSVKNMGTAKKYGKSVIIVLLCVALTIGGYYALKTALSYMPRIMNVAVSALNGGFLPADGPEMGAEELDDPLVLEDQVNPEMGAEELDVPLVLEDHVNLDRPDVVGNEDFSNARFHIWTDALQLFKASPIFGTSPRNHLPFAADHFGEDLFIYQRGYSVHNGYLSLLVYTGVLGTVFMAAWLVCLVVKVLGYIVRHRKDQDEYYIPVCRLTLVMFVVAMSAFPMMGIFFGNSIIEVLFWLVTGYCLYYIHMSEKENTDREPLLYRASEIVASKIAGKREK